MNDRELRQLRPFVQEWINSSIASARFTSTTTAGTVGGDTGGSGFTETDARALFYTQSQITTYRATHESNEDAHHPRNHPFLGSDHAIPVTGTGDVLWDPDGLGPSFQALPHDSTSGIDENNHHDRAHSIVSEVDHQWPAITRSVLAVEEFSPTWKGYGPDHRTSFADAGELVATDTDGYVYFARLETSQRVTTPALHSEDSHLYLNPDAADGYDIIWDGDADLVSDNHVSGNSGILLRPSSGLIDAYKIQVKELYAEAFIVQQKRAENGAIVITEGVTQLTRAFTVPNAGSSATLYVADYTGLGGYDVFEVGDDLRIFFMEEAQVVTQARWSSASYGYDVGTSAGGPIFSDDFEADSTGTNTGSEWKETGNGNSTVVDDAMYSIVTPPAGGGTRGIADNGTDVNAHIHYNGAGASAMTNYQVTGKVHLQTQMGWTIMSAYTDGTPTDEYYRVRFHGGGTIHMDNHGGVGNGQGTTSSAFIPTSGEYYQFKLEAEDTGSRTEIRFRIWLDGDPEPGTWLIDAYDDTAGRRTEGTFGFWSYNGSGSGNTWTLDQVDSETLTVGSGEYASVTVSGYIEQDKIALIQICAETTNFNDIIVTGPSLTLVGSYTAGNYTHAVWWRRIVSPSGGDGSWTFTLSNGNYGAISHMRVLCYGNIPTGNVIEASNTTGGTNVSSRTQAAMSNLTEGFGAFTFVAQHNRTGQVLITDSPNDYASGAHRSDGFAPNLQLEYRHTTGITSLPAYTWTAASARDFSVIAIAMEPGPPVTGSFSMGSAWGYVSSTSSANTEPDEQSWTWTTRTNSPGQGVTVGIDAAVLNYKDYDDGNAHGVIEITTIDQGGSPHMSFYTREQYDNALGRIPLTLHGRIGLLDGIAGRGPNEWGLYFTGGGGAVDGEFIMSTEESVLRNIPFQVEAAGGVRTVTIAPYEGLNIYTGSDWDEERALTFIDNISDDNVLRMGSYKDLWTSEYSADLIFDAGNRTSTYTSNFNHTMEGTGAGLKLNYYFKALQQNPWSEARINLKTSATGRSSVYVYAEDVEISTYTDGVIHLDTERVDIYENSYDDWVQFKLVNNRMALGFLENGGGWGVSNREQWITPETTHDGIKFTFDGVDHMHIRRDEGASSHYRRYAWFLGPVHSAAAAFIASTNNDSTSNIDHLWHDDTNNRWHFASDTTYKGYGNSGLAIGPLYLKTNPPNNTSLTGYNRLYVNSNGDLVVIFENGVTKTIATN